MTYSDDGLTIEDFTRSGWTDVLSKVEQRDCVNYRAAFYAQAGVAREAANTKLAAIFDLLGGLASMFIDANDIAEPLKPMYQGSGGRTPVPRDFDPVLGYLTDILPYVDDAELKARAADVLWLRKRDFKAAREAIVSYIGAARLGDLAQWPEAVARIQRALDIATQTNQRDLIAQISERVEERLSACDSTDATPLPARLMKLLQSRRLGDAKVYAGTAEMLALAAESRSDWSTARLYWDIQVDWHRISKDDEKILNARLRSAETYVREAEARTAEADVEGYMVAAHFLESAIHTLRDIGGQKERIAELHRWLLDHQRKGVSEMKAISHEFDASEMVAAATGAVAGKSLYDAIFALALLGRPPRLTTLRQQAQWQLQNSISAHIPMTYKNGMGRTVARVDPPEEGETAEAARLRVEMYKVASLGQVLHVHGYVEPARSQIVREHEVTEEDVMAIVSHNPFVPAGREPLFARGLQMGFRGDFAGAVHLLVPQIENSIRYLLEQLDVITSGLDDDGIQDERDLNRTLRLPEFTTPLTEVLRDDTLFDLRGLLVERYGSNLRNDMAHGLLDYGAFFTAPCVYLWWLTLRLCCIPVLTRRDKQAEDEQGLSNQNGDTAAGVSQGDDSDAQEPEE